MNRRNFLLGVIAGGVGMGAAGGVWLGAGPNDKSLTIDAALQVLDQLMEEEVTTLGEWDLSQILVHCAQSVEFSMSGFPEHKPPLFKNTVGKLAFAAFSVKGEMTHGLSEIIPGAPSIEEKEDTAFAFRRFRDAMTKFQNHHGQFEHHFAYGSLTRSEYERAHAMHFYNHLLEIELTNRESENTPIATG